MKDNHRDRTIRAAARAVLLFATIGTVFGNALAADSTPCATDGFRAFDFWIGEWDVHVADGTFAGSNQITAEQSDCLLTERWTGAKGNTGTSMNYFDPLAERWRQVWVSPGIIIDITGGLNGNDMLLTGEITYEQSALTAAFRGTWTPLEDGRVRQFFEQQDADGAWQPWFEGFYSRRAPGAARPTALNPTAPDQ